MKNIAFRVDANSYIGFGHIVRCISLAKEFIKEGYNVYFLMKMQEGLNLVKNIGFNCVQIMTKNEEDNYIDYEIQEIVNLIKNYRIDVLIVDSYRITRSFFIDIRKEQLKTVYIDDLNKFDCYSDFIVNGNINANNLKYKKKFDDQKLLLGIGFNLIRDEFKNLKCKKTSDQVKEIMITTGGGDFYNITPKIINNILNEYKNKFTLNVLVGQSFNNIDELMNIAKFNKNVILYQNVKSISSIMLKSDIAISSGGSTLYELCACGVPTISFIMADNQYNIVTEMVNRGIILTLGEKDELCRNMKRQINIICDIQIRKELSKRCRDIIDGLGTNRVLKEIVNENINNISCKKT